MSLQKYLTFSIITCNLLYTIDYTDWNKGSYSNGDKITITEANKELKSSITVNGVVNAEISKGGDCAFIGCFSNTSTINGNGTLNFTLKKSNGAAPAFTIKESSALTISVKNLNITGSFIYTLFDIEGGSLNLENTSITAKEIRNAIDAQQAKINITSSSADFGEIADILLEQSELTINNSKKESIKFGRIKANHSKSNINLSNNASIQGDFRGQEGNILDLNINTSGTFQGNISNDGNTKVDIKNNGSLKGSLIAKGEDLKVDLKSGKITGSITSSATTSLIDAKEKSEVGQGIFITDGENLTKFTGDSILKSGFNIGATAQANAIFDQNSKLLEGSSNLEGQSNLIFKDKASISNQTITSTGQTQIGFENQAKMQGKEIKIKEGSAQIDFKNQSAIVDASIIQTQGESIIKFDDQSRMEGNIKVTDGMTDITFTGTSKIKGDILAGGEKNKVTFTPETKLEGNLTFDGYEAVEGFSEGFLNGTHITGAIKGYDEVILQIGKTKVENGIFQGNSYNAKGMTATIDESIIEQGFEGNGETSNNHLSVADSQFSNSNIKQVQGSLKAEFVNTTGIKDFLGMQASNNLIELTHSEVNDISQDGGGLNLKTNAMIKGKFQGINQSDNALTITGSKIMGTITQNTGNLALRLNNSSAHEIITAQNSSFSLYGQHSTAKKDISLIESRSDGISSNFTLEGKFTQTGGTSNFTFANTQFNNLTTLDNTISSNLIFTHSTIKNIAAQNGNNSAILTNSEMGEFNGVNGVQAILLTTSKSGKLNQNNGSLTVNGSGSSEIEDIAGSNSSLIASLSNSVVNKDIQNTQGSTVINLQFAEVKGNVKQTAGSLNFSADNSEVKGKYEQSAGTSIVNFTKSNIHQGISLDTIAAGTLNFNQESKISEGFHTKNSSFNFTFRNHSELHGFFKQESGNVSGSLDTQSKINHGMILRDGSTTMIVTNQSEINATNNAAIQANNHITKVLLDHSNINGNLNIQGGSLDLTAQNQSSITSPQMELNHADLKLTIDTQSSFKGDLTQVNNKQDVEIKGDSIFEGNITNTNTTGTITINHAKLIGSITQEGGTLGLKISNEGKLEGNLRLNNANTTVSGMGINNEIGGNFTQTNGSLKGAMNGLTLKGTFTQTGGSSEVSFKDSEFMQDTSISNADQSSLTFINSKLKNYTIKGGNDNSLKLLDGTLMSGDLSLSQNSQTLLKMRDSSIKGKIDVKENSFLTLNTFNSQIIESGDITVNTGGLKGEANSTQIGGNINLENTQSDISFSNQSNIQGSITATQGNSTIKFNNSSIQGSITQNQGQINLDLSNTSSIGGDLLFEETIAHLTGAPERNRIGGKFTSTQSRLTGNIASLTVIGKFTQNKGSADIVFRDQSNLKGEVSIHQAEFSKLNFTNQSGISNKITINEGEENILNFSNESFVKNNETILTKAKVTINASDRSSLSGDILANSAISTLINFTNSKLEGDITQNKGIFNLNAQNTSELISTINFKEVNALINLQNGSSLDGSLEAQDSTLSFTLNNSRFNTIGQPNAVLLKNTPTSITANNNSIFGGNLSSTKEGNEEISADLVFTKGSTFFGDITLQDIKTNASFNHSTLLSELITLKGNTMNLSWINSPDGGVINAFNAIDTKLNIFSDHSLSTITQLTTKNTALDILVKNDARLQGATFLNENTQATYSAHTNANINLDTHIKGIGNTLKVILNGGIMQGAITQDGLQHAEVMLNTVGDFGGRWAVTSNSNAKSLSIENNPTLLETYAIFGSVFNNPLSFVDFTVEKEDTTFSTRMGKELLPRPDTQDGMLPPLAPNQTYTRELRLDHLSGNHGLFRVYTDLGNQAADHLYANTASGDHIIQVYYRVETFRDIGDDRIVVAKVDDPNTQVSFKGTQSDIGLTRYDTQIIKENAKEGGGFEWIIGQATPSGISYSSKIIGSILQSQYRTFAVEVDSLDRRLGYLRNIKRDQGFWARAYFGRATQEATEIGVNITDSYYSIWSGWDYNQRGLTGLNFAGVLFNYTGINSQSKDFIGNASNFAIGFYNTFEANSGFYFDILAKYIYTTNQYEISSYALDKNTPDFTNHKFLANFEMGYTFYLGERARSSYIQPQFQITSGYIQESDLSFVDVTGEHIRASIGHNSPVIMRFGAFWGKMFGDAIRTDLKVGSSFVYDLNSGGQLNFSDSAVSLQRHLNGDFRMLFSAHADLLFTDNFKMYSSFDTSFFGNYNTSFNFNLGMRVTFGHRNDVLSSIPMTYDNSYVPPRSIDDPRTIPVIQKNTTRDIDYSYMGKPRRVEKQIPGNPAYTPNNLSPNVGPSRRSYRDNTLGYYNQEQQ